MGVFNAQQFAVDKLKEWLPKYKFKHWNETETRKLKVTEEMKLARAEEIANKLIDHSTWRMHGRSLKIDDLENIGLRIKNIDVDARIKDIVYRIKIVIMLLFGSSMNYKIFFTKDEIVVRNVMQNPDTTNKQNIRTPIAEINANCPKCGKQYPIYAKFGNIPKNLEEKMNKKSQKFPVDNKIQCDCGFTFDLTALRNQLENQLMRKIID
jgi:hypothetical protein